MKNETSPSASEPTQTPWQDAAHCRRRILVVDDDSDVRLLYADALMGPDFKVDFAADGPAGWEALRANHYDLLITEQAIPKLTGVELVRKLRDAQMPLPVVMVAGKIPARELARNPSLQLVATMVKPFSVDTLLSILRSVLRAPNETGTTPPSGASRSSADGLRR